MSIMLKNWSCILFMSLVLLISILLISEVAFDNISISAIVFIYMLTRYAYLFGFNLSSKKVRILDLLMVLITFAFMLIVITDNTKHINGMNTVFVVIAIIIFVIQLIACSTPIESPMFVRLVNNIGQHIICYNKNILISIVLLNLFFIIINTIIPDSFSIWCLLVLLPSIVIICFLLIPKTKNIVLYNLNCRALGLCSLFICTVTGSLLLISLCPSYYTYYRYFFNTPVNVLFGYYALLCSILLFYGLRKCEENDYPYNNFHLIKNWENHYKEDEIKEQVFPKNFSEWANK